jgi:hypothetical protein
LNLLSFGHLVDERFTITHRGVDQGADEFLVHNVHGIVPTDGTVRDVVFSRVVSNDNIYEPPPPTLPAARAQRMQSR